jgi:hypothetical protein
MFKDFDEYTDHQERNCTELCSKCELKFDPLDFCSRLDLCHNCSEKCDGCGDRYPANEIHHGLFDEVLRTSLDLCKSCSVELNDF